MIKNESVKQLLDISKKELEHLSINELCKVIVNTAQARGFYDCRDAYQIKKANLESLLKHLEREVKEAEIEWVTDNMETEYNGKKYQGFATEVSDVVILGLSILTYMGYNAEKEVKNKVAYNIIREFLFAPDDK